MRTDCTKLTCPDCGGALERLEDGNLVQYRCRVGHLYSPEAALAIHAEREENTLWTAVAILEEGADLADQVADLRPAEERSELRRMAAAKRELAEQARKTALELSKNAVA